MLNALRTCRTQKIKIKRITQPTCWMGAVKMEINSKTGREQLWFRECRHNCCTELESEARDCCYFRFLISVFRILILIFLVLFWFWLPEPRPLLPHPCNKDLRILRTHLSLLVTGTPSFSLGVTYASFVRRSKSESGASYFLFSFHFLPNRKFLCLWQTVIIRGSWISANYNGRVRDFPRKLSVTGSERLRNRSNALGICSSFQKICMNGRKSFALFEMERWHPQDMFANALIIGWEYWIRGITRICRKIYGNTKEQWIDYRQRKRLNKYFGEGCGDILWISLDICLIE